MFASINSDCKLLESYEGRLDVRMDATPSPKKHLDLPLTIISIISSMCHQCGVFCFISTRAGCAHYISQLHCQNGSHW